MDRCGLTKILEQGESSVPHLKERKRQGPGKPITYVILTTVLPGKSQGRPLSKDLDIMETDDPQRATQLVSQHPVDNIIPYNL